MLTAMTITTSILWVLGYYPLHKEVIDDHSEPFEYVLLFFLWPYIVIWLIIDDIKLKG